MTVDPADKSLEIWKDDVLGRREDAEYIHTYLVNRYKSKETEPGFVLAINAEWGYGKSFMLKKLQEQILLQGYPAVFFDAWANDFTPDPLLAFIAELDAGLKNYFKHIPIVDGLKNQALDVVKKHWKTALTVLAYASAKQLAGISADHIRNMIVDSEISDNADEDELDENSDESEKSTIDIATVKKDLETAVKKALSEHTTTKSAISLFKKKLSILIDALKDIPEIELPIFIFVDELDRCRPDYAIELLEGIKHLFGVSGVYFVVGTNIEQLSQSIRAVYGANFDGQRYLKRFFDLQYELPEPDNLKFSKMLFKKMTVPKLENIIYGLQPYEVFSFAPSIEQTSENVLSHIFANHTAAFEIGLRDQLQIANIIEASLLSLAGEKIHAFLLIFLAVTYHKNPVIFRNIAQAKNLSDATGFPAIKKMNSLGQIKVPIHSNQMGEGSQLRSFSMIQIAEIYFDYLSSDSQIRANINSYNFPANMMAHAYKNNISSDSKPIFEKYFDIIRYAGNFSGKK